MTATEEMIMQTTKTQGVDHPHDSFPEWCVYACDGDALLAVDLAVGAYAAMRLAETRQPT